MPRKPKSRPAIGGGPVPTPTYWDKENQTAKFGAWLTDYTTRAAAKNELAKSRKKEKVTE